MGVIKRNDHQLFKYEENIPTHEDQLEPKQAKENLAQGKKNHSFPMKKLYLSNCTKFTTIS